MKKAFKWILFIAVVCLIVSKVGGKEVKPTLSNPNAITEAQTLYDLLSLSKDMGYTLSAQQESTWMGSDDFEFIYINEKTGKYPAIRGFDYMNDSRVLTKEQLNGTKRAVLLLSAGIAAATFQENGKTV